MPACFLARLTTCKILRCTQTCNWSITWSFTLFRFPCSSRSVLWLSFCGPLWPVAAEMVKPTTTTISTTGQSSHLTISSISVNTTTLLRDLRLGTTCSKNSTCRSRFNLLDSKWTPKMKACPFQKNSRRGSNKLYSKLSHSKTKWGTVPFALCNLSRTTTSKK